MTIDDRITRVKELIARREEIDRQLADLFGGIAPARKILHCSTCGASGHNAKSCPANAPRDPKPAPDAV